MHETEMRKRRKSMGLGILEVDDLEVKGSVVRAPDSGVKDEELKVTRWGLEFEELGIGGKTMEDEGWRSGSQDWKKEVRGWWLGTVMVVGSCSLGAAG